MSDKGRPGKLPDDADQFWIEREGKFEYFMFGDRDLYQGIAITPQKAREMARLLTEYAEGRSTLLVLDLDPDAITLERKP